MSNEGARDASTTTKEGKENNAVDALLPHAPDEDVEAKTETSENNWPRKSSRARKKSEKLCSVDRCTNAAVNDGMCKRHGAEMTNKLCSAEGCTNYAIKQGFCVRHGHGAKTPVIPPPPSYPPPGYLRFAGSMQSGKNSTKSDRGGISAAGDTKRKRSSGDDEEEAPKKDGKKYKKRRKCSHDGCNNLSIKKGLCWRHGAKNLVNRNRCIAEGCNNHVQQGGLCRTHGAKVKVKFCSFQGCTNQVKRGGMCTRHWEKIHHGANKM